MTTATDHALNTALSDAARGVFPPADGRAVAVGALDGPCDMMAFFAHHVIVAADVEQNWLDEQYVDRVGLGGSDPSTGLGKLIGAVTERLGNPAVYASMTCAAPPRSAYLNGKIEENGEPDSGWAAYRTDIRCFQYSSPGAAGAFAVGRGPGGRWDVFFRVDEGPGGRVGRELLAAAKTVIPTGATLFGSTPLHDHRVTRIAIASGFQPICTEVLFLTRPQ
ncbi:hypothetical protein [Pseudonocardia spinosispora]|uniref:hypothetical protein n=1 Tax=Pseudonocardia spinosispora TaxID=103441 RepID=UPI0012EBB97C|nr:hypothetical protein [Pseudonocardia spinosispora]